MNHNFDELFIESKVPDCESLMNSNMSIEYDPRSEQISNLLDKIKYQEIEINMLKKYKAEVQKYQA